MLFLFPPMCILQKNSWTICTGQQYIKYLILTHNLSNVFLWFSVNYIYENALPFVIDKPRLAHSVIAEDGAEMELGAVKVSFPAGSLPFGTKVTSMSQELQDGVPIIGGTVMSPLVTVGPHTGLQLRLPVTVHLPISSDADGEMTVMVSHTSSYDDFLWERVSDEMITHPPGSSYVEVRLLQCTLLYAQKSPTLLILINECLYFSVSVSVKKFGHRNERFLSTRFSSTFERALPEERLRAHPHQESDGREQISLFQARQDAGHSGWPRRFDSSTQHSVQPQVERRRRVSWGGI